MAEICLDCWNKINKTNYPERKYVLSDYLDLCEECGCYKRIIIIEKRYYYLHKLRYVLIPLKIIDFLLRLICFPYFIFIRIKPKRRNKTKPTD
ncbi:MAG: hypothetical protein IJN40_04330 [Clostridia bacterium]|nr:hypothetical protein [Clostridia bacterium]